MKSKLLKKTLAVTLGCVMAFNMAACEKKPGQGGGNDVIDTQTLSPEEAMQASKLNVYKEEVIKLPDEITMDGKGYINGEVIAHDNKLYFMVDASTWVYDGAPDEDAGNTPMIEPRTEGITEVEVVEDGVNIPVEFPVENVEVDDGFFEGDYPSGHYIYDYSTCVYDLSDGSYNKVKLQNVNEVENAIGDTWLNLTVYDKDFEKIYGLYNCGHWDEQEGIYTSDYSLACWNCEDGSLLYYKNLFSTAEDEWMNIGHGFIGADGNIKLLASGDSASVYNVSTDGELLGNTKYTDPIWEDQPMVFFDKSGKAYVIVYNYNESTEKSENKIAEVNLDNGKVVTEYDLPSSVDMWGNVFPGVNEGEFIYTGETGIMKYHVGDDKATPFMNYINSDFMSGGMNNIIIVDDNSFIGVYYDEETYDTKFGKFTYVDPKDIPDKTTLILGCNYLDYNVKKQVITFNKENNEFRISVKNYCEDADWEQAMVNFNNDIVGGKMPDILLLDDPKSLRNYAKKGILVDFNELIKNDPELSKNEYLDNVFKSLSTDEIMYALPYSFSLDTFIAKKSLVGSPEKFTMAEAQEALKKMEPDATLFQDMTRDTFVYYALLYSGTSIFDVDKNECHFDSDDFIAILEYAKTLPKEYSEEYWMEKYDGSDYYASFRNNQTLLYDFYLYNFTDAIQPLHGIMGEDVSYVGFPTENGSGAYISPTGTPFAISSKSASIDGAWSFVRQYITEDYQMGYEGEYGHQNNFWGLPVLKKALVEDSKRAMERPSWKNPDTGEIEYYDYYAWINNEDVVIPPLSQEEVDQILEYIYSINDVPYYDEDIMKVIEEETEAYFTNNKSAQDVANVIQSKISIMLSEKE